MKKLVSLFLILLLALALTACDSIPNDDSGENSDDNPPSDGSDDGIRAEDGIGIGRTGDLVHTYFFDFTVNSAYTTQDYNGYTPSQEGYQLLVVDTTVKNTYTQSITMWDTDFQAQWTASEETGEYAYPITDDGALDPVASEQFPAEYELAISEERTGTLVYEVPADEKDFSVSTLEIFDDGSVEGKEGDTYAVFFTATAQ